MKFILDLGCGKHKAKGAIGVDCEIDSDADVIFNLEKFPYPIKDNVVDSVISKHLLEHMHDPIRVLKEICRIVKTNGEILVEVPHFSSHIAYGLGHKHLFSYKEIIQIIKNDLKCNIIKAQITFYKSFRWSGIMFLANKFPIDYERFWTYIFPAENIKVTFWVVK